MAAPGRTLTVYLAADTRKAQAELAGFSAGLDKFGRMLQTAVVAGAAVAGAALVKFGIDSVKAASRLQQSMGAVDTVFKRNAGQIEAWAQTAAESAGLSQAAYQEMAAVLGAQLRAAGLSLNQATTATRDLVQVGADLAATFGGETSDAVAALGAVLRGEYDSIERFGVSIKQSDINARLAAQGQADLEGQALKTATAQAALALITQQTADATGAFARESDTLTGQQQRLQAQLENVQAAVGQALLPALTAITRHITTQLLPAFQQWWAKHGKQVEQNISDIADALTTLTSGSGADAVSWLDQMAGLLDGLATVLKTVSRAWKAVNDAAEDGNVIAKGALDATKQMLNPLGMLETALYVVKRAWDAVYGAVENVIGALSNAIAKIQEFWSRLPTGGFSLPTVTSSAAAAPRAATTSTSTRATASTPVTININTGVGDPVNIAREVQKVLTTRQVRLGVT